MAFLHFHTFHPMFAVLSIALVSLLAWLIGRLVPFYRRELLVEDITRLTPLDGLRGLLCFGVMYHHAAINHAFLTTGVWEETPSIFYRLLGQSAVALFFCITGFLFWGRALARQGDLAPLPFYRGRWFRVVPLYVFTMLLALVLAHRQINWHRLHTYRCIGEMGLMGLMSWSNIWTGKGAADVNAVNAGVTWTLQYEWAFYLALPALAMIAKAGNGWRFLLVVLGCWVMWGVNVNLDTKFFFVSGMLAAHLARMPRVTAALRTFFSAVVVLVLLLMMPRALHTGYGWRATLITTAIFIPIACGNSLFGVLNFSGLRLMGVISYSVYLLHGMIFYTTRPFLGRMLERGEYQYWAAVVALAFVVLLCCCLTYRCIEWPLIQMEKRLRRRVNDPMSR